jgi:hypothetical protein
MGFPKMCVFISGWIWSLRFETISKKEWLLKGKDVVAFPKMNSELAIWNNFKNWVTFEGERCCGVSKNEFGGCNVKQFQKWSYFWRGKMWRFQKRQSFLYWFFNVEHNDVPYGVSVEVEFSMLVAFGDIWLSAAFDFRRHSCVFREEVKKVQFQNHWFFFFFISKQGKWPAKAANESPWCSLSCAGHFFCYEKARQVTSIGKHNGANCFS